MDAIALQQAAAGRTLSCTAIVGPVLAGYYDASPHNAMAMFTASWDSAGTPSYRVQQINNVAGDSGWLQAASITSTTVNYPTAILSPSGYSCLQNGSVPPEGWLTCNQAWGSGSVGISVNVATQQVTYTFSGSIGLRAYSPINTGEVQLGSGSCSASMTLQ